MKELSFLAAAAILVLSCKTTVRPSTAESKSTYEKEQMVYRWCSGAASEPKEGYGVLRIERGGKQAQFSMYSSKASRDAQEKPLWQENYIFAVTPSSQGVLLIQGKKIPEEAQQEGTDEFTAVGISNGKGTAVSLRVIRAGLTSRFDELDCV